MWEIRVGGACVQSLLLFLDFEILFAMQVKGLLQFSIRHSFWTVAVYLYNTFTMSQQM